MVSALLVLTLILDFAWKDFKDFQEYMWACYWASLAMIVGISWSDEYVTNSAGLFFISLGTPSWLMGMLLAHRHADATSYLMHLLPMLGAYFGLRKARFLSFHTVIGAWVLFSVPFSLTAVTCDPVRNINLVRGVRLARVGIPGSNTYDVLLLVGTLIWVWLAQRLINKFLVSDGTSSILEISPIGRNATLISMLDRIWANQKRNELKQGGQRTKP